eukprot:CAMPEP_0201220578 /NCGR_PEP_ID=MMETSP0851-20130426/191667_1 /ASSEMBLY_ACC=CAM_ASM_000631 /TAXON_ID=183588 /ORGANISM="Pseudo-nitzschia fraudulenta, Strain WWA7" /LENGTH=619 /DNA_ID=CAMNT_0047510307 /DNA_START=121 /DNA_END=1980 /DNA_ORIENTATION=+
MPRSTRRSARNRGTNDIVAPGFGTNSDINQLTRDLGGSLPRNAVLAMMQSEGRGLVGASSTGSSSSSNNNNNNNAGGARAGLVGASSTGSSSSSNNNNNNNAGGAWADFLQEEVGSAVAAAASKTESSSSSAAANASKSSEPPTKKPKTGKGPEASSSDGAREEYDLSALSASDDGNAKKKKGGASYGSLVQSGTLDSTMIGRKNLRATDRAVYHLLVPTVLMPLVAITKVCASCNAAHAVAIDKSNQAYGWGRNEGLVLGSEFGEETRVVPTPRIIATEIETASLGKSHTLFLKTDGTLHALGQNKVGQCAWRGSVKQSGVLKACIVSGVRKDDPGVVFAKIACGEDFSLALSDKGVLYSTGNAEFGQLGNGETGEHFVTANKIAFLNSFGFAPQTVFVENDPDDTGSGDLGRKTTTVATTVKIQDIAAGKHHALALEAPPVGGGSTGTRIFSWGRGNYGVLGHNRQKDEYYPRHVSSLQRGMTFTRLAAGSNCSLGLTAQGHVYYWGNHRSNAEAVMKPQLVDALANNQHVVTHIGAGPGSVACTTDLGNTVVWGSGPYGELGLEGRKSSAKPAFVESISGLVCSDMAVGQGSILYVIRDDAELPRADLEAIEACLK